MTKSISETGSQKTIDLRDAAVETTFTLGKIKTTIPPLPEDGTPQAGTRQPAGKSNQPDAVLYGKDPGTRPVSAVRQAEEVKGAARKSIDIQVSGDDVNSPNGNPKRRTRNRWGTEDNKGA
jgi:hypothetical protein